jgi:hypothetical protein
MQHNLLLAFAATTAAAAAAPFAAHFLSVCAYLRHRPSDECHQAALISLQAHSQTSKLNAGHASLQPLIITILQHCRLARADAKC